MARVCVWVCGGAVTAFRDCGEGSRMPVPPRWVWMSSHGGVYLQIHNFQFLIWGFPCSISGFPCSLYSFPSLQGLCPRPEEKFPCWGGTGRLGDSSLKIMAEEKQLVVSGRADVGIHVSEVLALAHLGYLRRFS